MNNRELIFKSIEIIEENIRGNISVYELSERLGFSFYYFSRLFKSITGYSPKNYMLSRKVTESVNDILNSGKKIIEIAFDYGFTTPESYSRAFQKIIGLNPSDVKKQNIVDKNKLFRAITKNNLLKHPSIPGNKPEVVILGPIHLIGISLYFETWEVNDLTGPWKYFESNISSIQNRIKPEKYYQMQTWSFNNNKETISFFIALEVENINEIPVCFSAKKLPKQKYLKFLHKGYANEVGLTYQYIYDEWLPDSEYRLPYFYNFEYYGDLHKGPCDKDSISEIYIPVE